MRQPIKPAALGGSRAFSTCSKSARRRSRSVGVSPSPYCAPCRMRAAPAWLLHVGARSRLALQHGAPTRAGCYVVIMFFLSALRQMAARPTFFVTGGGCAEMAPAGTARRRRYCLALWQKERHYQSAGSWPQPRVGALASASCIAVEHVSGVAAHPCVVVEARRRKSGEKSNISSINVLRLGGEMHASLYF